jgi:alkylhydroperoxidase/carboxymuconolactone decarboxylase family protein YurZ
MPTTDTPVLDVLAAMTEASVEATTLDDETLVLTRLAALVASDAPPMSYALNLTVAGEMGIDLEKIRGVLTAIAPIVGTARVGTALGNIFRGLALEELREFDDGTPA